MTGFKNYFKKIFPHKHDWILSYMVGDFNKYKCKNNSCIENKYTLETSGCWDFSDPNNFKKLEDTYKELTAEEAASHIKKSEAAIKATMWILDNVEPTVSIGREEDSKIVEK